MTELDLIIDLHKRAERQGPGSQRDTLRALSFLDFPSDKEIAVADLGCGTGGQTLTLARELNARITSVDLFPEFLEILRERAAAAGLKDFIYPLQASMEELPFEEEQFDLIWSEGAIYNVGFERGIQEWKAYLKPGGYLAVSEITWITDHRPDEVEAFWNREYPEISPASRKIKQLESNGYTLVGYFYLSPDSWLDHYYRPLRTGFPDFLARHEQSEAAQKVVEDHRTEIEFYEKFRDCYSYGFYVARKN